MTRLAPLSCACLILLGASLLPAQQPPAAPVPPAILAAKTIFVSNGGADSGLFPQPFSGDPNRSYNEFYTALKATGQFQLVDSPAQADLVLELRLIAPYGPTSNNKQLGASDPLPMFRLEVYDRPTHYILWTVTGSIDSALLQKTHDRNFDQTLQNVLDQFLTAAGKPVPPPHRG